MEHEIQVADYHRNGVGGAPFYVGLVKSDGEQYLVIDMRPEEGADGEVAVLNMAQLRAGNIGMYPVCTPDGVEIEGQGGAAYRGDHWIDAADMMREWVSASMDRRLAMAAAARASRELTS
jgi:hypothetical protein